VAEERHGWRTLPLATGAQMQPGLLVYRFNHSMYYANAQQLSTQITELAAAAQPPLRWLCIDAAAVDDIDFSAAATLRELHSLLQTYGTRLVLTQVGDEVHAQLDRYGLTCQLGRDAYYETVGEMVAAFDQPGGGADGTHSLEAS
jgi:SulP family sulfate permease